MRHPELNSIPEILADIRIGRPVIIVDDEDRENEGDFILAAEKATPEAMNFLTTHGRGLVCVPLPEERCRELNLQFLVKPETNNSPFGTPFTMTVDLLHKTTTGISCSDRSKTTVALSDPSCTAGDFVRPGHIFPLMAQEGGVLTRRGHTEAAIDLAKLAGLRPAGVLCEILQEDGSMARLPKLLEIAKTHNLKISSIDRLVEYRKKHDYIVHHLEQVQMPTKYGPMQLHLYKNPLQEQDYHYALVGGAASAEERLRENYTPLVRIHSECFSGDIFGSQRCDCGEQLEQAMKQISESPFGILIYLRQEGRGIGAINKIKAYALQDQGHDTISANHQLGHPADLRHYTAAAQILRHLKVEKIRLITNNPQKVQELIEHGINVVERCAAEVQANEFNRFYLQTKRDRMGHLSNLRDTLEKIHETHQHQKFQELH